MRYVCQVHRYISVIKVFPINVYLSQHIQVNFISWKDGCFFININTVIDWFVQVQFILESRIEIFLAQLAYTTLLCDLGESKSSTISVTSDSLFYVTFPIGADSLFIH